VQVFCPRGSCNFTLTCAGFETGFVLMNTKRTQLSRRELHMTLTDKMQTDSSHVKWQSKTHNDPWLLPLLTMQKTLLRNRENLQRKPHNYATFVRIYRRCTKKTRQTITLITIRTTTRCIGHNVCWKQA